MRGDRTDCRLLVSVLGLYSPSSREGKSGAQGRRRSRKGAMLHLDSLGPGSQLHFSYGSGLSAYRWHSAQRAGPFYIN